MFVVYVKPPAHCFSVVRRSIFDNRALALRPESLCAKEMALLRVHTTHLAVDRHHRSACHSAVLVDNNVQSTRSSPHSETAVIESEYALPHGVRFAKYSWATSRSERWVA